MECLAAWLRRLPTLKATDARRTTLRMFSPGHQVMDFDDWLITTEQPRLVPEGYRAGFPEVVSVVAYVEEASRSQNMNEHHRLSTDLAAALSVALERTIDIPLEMSNRVAGHDTVTFVPLGGMVDRVISGPIPPDYKDAVAKILKGVSGLLPEDIVVVGAATSLFHGALLLHERDVRAAYTLLVAGIETLSRRYGAPPTSWEAWDGHAEWDQLVAKLSLSPEHGMELREQLMQDRQLRLKSTFRAYASGRLRESFWDKPWTEWMYAIEMPQGRWRPAEKIHEGKIGDFLPRDRSSLSKTLGHSYDLRSTYVHAGSWFGPLELSINAAAALDVSKPLPFAALRAILRELICTELEERSVPANLPDTKLRRNWKPIQPP